jgi:hypothetical protein
MAKEFPLRLRGAHARVVDRMVESGMADDDHGAVETALLAFGRQADLLDDAEVLKALRAQAARDPLNDRELADGIRRVRVGRRA